MSKSIRNVRKLDSMYGRRCTVRYLIVDNSAVCLLGVKWLCSDCAPSNEESGAESSEGGLEGRKRRRLQGQNPLREKREAILQQPPPAAKKRRGRPVGYRPAKKVKSDHADRSSSSVKQENGHGSTSPTIAEPIPKPARVSAARKSGVEGRAGVCSKCQLDCNTTQDAVECDKVLQFSSIEGQYPLYLCNKVYCFDPLIDWLSMVFWVR